MTTLKEFNQYGEQLEKLLKLNTSPVAVKMLEKESEIPRCALRPRKQRGYHLAQCQAFALSRRESTMVAMLREDNLCPGAVIAYGLEKLPEDSEALKNNCGDCFPVGQYIGILTAPLQSVEFKPDGVIIYCDTNQLRDLLLALKQEERPQVTGHFFPASCASAVVTPILKGQYTVSLPDPGEYARALTLAGEMMFSFPGSKLVALVNNLSHYKKAGRAYAQYAGLIMRPDFPQPDFYQKVFADWGLEHQK